MIKKTMWVVMAVMVGLLNPTLAEALTQKGVPQDYIKSPDGYITVGFEREFGGAVSYYADSRIKDETEAQGNMLNNSNSGALLSTAIWTLKNFPGWNQPNRETNLGWCDKRNSKFFPKSSASSTQDWIANRIECYKLNLKETSVPGSLPFNNPTQGGVGLPAWDNLRYGINPNPLEFSISNNRMKSVSRMVNFNYSLEEVPATAANADLWQTDVWNEMEVYFHPQYSDVLVIDQKIVYCRDMNTGCKDKELSFQDNQLSTLFPATTIYGKPFSGPFEKFAFREMGRYSIRSVGTSSVRDTVIENWQAALNKNNMGIGEAVYKYRYGGLNYVGKGEGFGSVGGEGALGVAQPDLSEFEHSGIRPISADPKDPRFTFSPGGWYKFRTFIATGELSEIRRKILAVTDKKMDPDKLANIPRVERKVSGYVDVVNCSNVFGWAADSGVNGHRVGVTVEYTPMDGSAPTYTKTATANGDRGDGGASLRGACPPDGLCGYGVAAGNFPGSFKDKKIRVKVWATAANGGIDLLKYGDSADSVIGPCTNVSSSTPTMTPTLTTASPTLKPTATYKAGDADNNGVVNVFDFIIWKKEFVTKVLEKADFDKNGKVDLIDFQIWKRAYATRI